MSFLGGTRVRLQTCLHGEPGIVVGVKYGKVIVEWPDLKFIGKHAPGSLTSVQDARRGFEQGAIHGTIEPEGKRTA